MLQWIPCPQYWHAKANETPTDFENKSETLPCKK